MARRDRSFVLARLMCGAAIVVGASGCPASLENAESFEAGDGGLGSNGHCPDVPTAVLSANCAQSGCHGTVAPAASLDLQSPNVGARLLDVKPALCSASRALVDSKNPDESLVYQKLKPNPPCGSRMPLTGHYLSDSDTACVRAWMVSLAVSSDGGASDGAYSGEGASDAAHD